MTDILYPRTPPTRLTGDERFVCGPPDMTVLDFWQWAHSSLNSNLERGKLAEYIVMQALGGRGRTAVQEVWADWDLAVGNVHIEVKASGYLQDRDQTKLSTIKFSGLLAKEVYYSEAVKPLAEIGDRGLKAHLYVLCVQTHRERGTHTVLDLQQWRFFVLTREQLEPIVTASGVSLSALSSAAFEPVDFTELGVRLARLVREIGAPA